MTQEQRLAAAEALTDVLARTTGTAEHPTGLARATATATGELVSLDLHPAALAQGPGAVGRLVVETARLATDAAAQKSYNELAKALGDGLATAVEAFAGPPPFRTATTTPHGTPAPPPRTSPPSPPPPPRTWRQQARRTAPRPRPDAFDDDDDYFADPFRGQRQ
ncbi:YbaB/EbfC family nucleoid-associated protein [Saccharothrix syringae]|uniref:YbaB/EbfC family DNA-binding protein n=1 Tax=Saccharothrix syringae TaxID=103733 RepID=A0A5Q0HAR8_SACSY|nr:YbaB/EbfC family nucleoid-associated protein [Saccharothrix syringae]QFZ23311.1 YbaB/EbfC family DNA-binding protein [Saccharothrix syringae]